MKIADYEEVYKLWSGTAGMGLRSLDDSYEGIEKFLLRNPRTNFVVESSNNIIGVILSGHDGRRGYIYHMAVDMLIRRNGIGKLLLNSALDALKNVGINVSVKKTTPIVSNYDVVRLVNI
jgi:ribosomal protein S18 acetylase RimI-like enzyme